MPLLTHNPNNSGHMPQAFSQITPDFKQAVPVPSVHNGQPIWLTECSELVDGRWECFVSIRPRTEAQ